MSEPDNSYTGRALRPRFEDWPPSLLAVARASRERPPTSISETPGGGYIFEANGHAVMVRSSNASAVAAITAQLRRDMPPRGRVVFARDYLAFILHGPSLHRCLVVDNRVPSIELFEADEDRRQVLALLLYQLALPLPTVQEMYVETLRFPILAHGRPVMSMDDEELDVRWRMARVEVPEDLLSIETPGIEWVQRHELPYNDSDPTSLDRLVQHFADYDNSMLAMATFARRGGR